MSQFRLPCLTKFLLFVSPVQPPSFLSPAPQAHMLPSALKQADEILPVPQWGKKLWSQGLKAAQGQPEAFTCCKKTGS